MSDKAVTEISQTEKEVQIQNDKEQDEPPEGNDEVLADEKDEGSCTTDSESEEDEDMELWEKQFAFTKVGLDIFTNPGKDVKCLPMTDCNTNGDNHSCVSPASTQDVFEECVSYPFDDTDAKAVLLDDGTIKDTSVGEQGLAPPRSPVVTPKEPPVNQQLSKDVPHINNFTEDNGSTTKKFSKGIPLDPSETWDFSLQALNPDFKSKVLWIEGSFYQKMLGNCLHEMHNVPCECDEKKKISVCRLCHTVFCSNKCFKKAIKAQTGEEDDDGENEEPELSQQEVKIEATVEAQTSAAQSKSKPKFDKNKYDAKIPPGNKPFSKVEHPSRNQPENPMTADKNKRFQQNFKTNDDRGNDYQSRQSRNQQYFNNPNAFSGTQQFPAPPSQGMWPTQVHVSHAFSTLVNTLSSSTAPLRSPSYNAAGNSKTQQYSKSGNFGSSNSMEYRSNDTTTGNLAAQERSEDGKNIGGGFRSSPNKERSTPDVILRNPKPFSALSDKDENQFFFSPSKRGNDKHSPKPPSPNSPKPRSEDESPEQKSHKQRYNSDPAESCRSSNEVPYCPPPNNDVPVKPPKNVYNNTSSNGNLQGSMQGGGGTGTFDRFGKNSQSEGINPGQLPPKQEFYDRNGEGHNNSWRKDSAPGYKNQNLGTKRDNFGRHQEPPFANPSEENVGPNGNQANFATGFTQSSHNHQFKGRGGRSDGGSYKGGRNFDNVPFSNDNPTSQYSPHPPPYPSPNRNEGLNQISSTNATCSGPCYRDREPSKSSLSYNHSSRGSTNKDIFHYFDNLDVPNEVLLPVKYIGGKDFYDFSVMPLWNWELFTNLQSSLQNVKKQEMGFIEFGRYCLVKYRPTESDNFREEWYRAKITKDLASKVGVYFLDLGRQAIVRRNDVFELLDESLLKQQRPLAIRITCLNVKVQNNDPDVVEQFNTLVREGTMKIRITHKDMKEPFRFGCYLDVQHIGKWFDAGVLLKKLQVGDQATPKDIQDQEQQKFIIPFKKNPIPPEVLQVSDGKKSKIEIKARITHVVGPNEFYVTTPQSNKTKTLIEDRIRLPNVELKPLRGLAYLSYPLLMWADKQNTRARVKVLEMTHNSKSAIVQNVDTGEIKTVLVAELNLLPKTLHHPINCTYKCSLPVKLVSKTGSKAMPLFEEATKTLQQMKGQHFNLNVFFLDANTHIVDLCLPSSSEGCTKNFIKNGWVELAHDVDLTINMPKN